MLFTAFYFVAALVVSASGSCVRTATCPCGTSGKTYTFCIDGIVVHGDPCDRWTQCKTCRDSYPYCVTCPAGRFGGLCVTVSVRKPKRKKRQSSRWRNTDLRRRSGRQSRGCRHPGVDPNGEIDAFGIDERKSNFDVGTELSYTCKKGFSLRGQKSIYCLATGSWSHGHPKCEPEKWTHPPVPEVDIECVELDPILHGRMRPIGGQDSLDVSIPIGTELQFSCDEGYKMIGNDHLECNADGYWSDVAPTCIEANIEDVTSDVSCVAQEFILNGRVFRTIGNEPSEELTEDSDIMTNPVGTQLQFTCNSGYSLYGQATSICEPTGFWSAVPPACVEDSPSEGIDCVPLDPIPNGKVHRVVDANKPPVLITEDSYDIEFPVGTLLQYTCDIGYILDKPGNLFCQKNGFWNGDVPNCVLDCGVSMLEPHSKLTNANRTTAGEWPWMVSISEFTRRNFTSMICGGALIDRRTIITAAHCFNANKNRYALHFGKFYRRNNDNTGVERRVVERGTHITIHPQFNRETYANDIAIIKLDSSLQYTERILPICLPTPESSAENLFPGNIGIVTGWGMNELALPADLLMMANLPIQSTETCTKSFLDQGLDFRMRSGMFCAGYPEGVVAACRGDSGSPFFFWNKNTNRYTTEGCVSFSVRGECGLRERYTVFTKISNYLDWISKNRRRRPSSSRP